MSDAVDQPHDRGDPATPRKCMLFRMSSTAMCSHQCQAAVRIQIKSSSRALYGSQRIDVLLKALQILRRVRPSVRVLLAEIRSIERTRQNKNDFWLWPKGSAYAIS